MDARRRQQNERKYGTWRELPGGGRLYSYDVRGRSGWRATYVKEVDAEELTGKFYGKCTTRPERCAKFITSIRSISATSW
jgi:hypothetical protein